MTEEIKPHAGRCEDDDGQRAEETGQQAMSMFYACWIVGSMISLFAPAALLVIGINWVAGPLPLFLHYVSPIFLYFVLLLFWPGFMRWIEAVTDSVGKNMIPTPAVLQRGYIRLARHALGRIAVQCLCLGVLLVVVFITRDFFAGLEELLWGMVAFGLLFPLVLFVCVAAICLVVGLVSPPEKTQ